MNVSGVNSSVDYGKVASGKKVNSAADDASGLEIIKKLESQTKGLDQGSSNAKDGIGVANIADGALSGIQDYLQRIKELSVKALNGLNSPSDLRAIQKEIDGSLKGIQDIAKGTEFNTKKLLDGSMADMDIATNPDGSGMKIKMADATLSSLGIDGYDVTGKFDMSKIDKALDMVSQSRSEYGAATNRLQYAYNSNTNASLQHTSSQSRIESLDMPKAISELKKNELLEDYKTMMQKKREEQESLVTKLLQ